MWIAFFDPTTLTSLIFSWWRHFLHSPQNSIGRPSTNMISLVKCQNLNLRLAHSEETGAKLTIRILRFGTTIWKRFYAQNSIKLIFETCVPWDFNTIYYVHAHKGHFQIMLHATRWIQSFHFQFEFCYFFFFHSPVCLDAENDFSNPNKCYIPTSVRSWFFFLGIFNCVVDI